MKAELQEYLKERKCPKCGDSDVATQFCQEENDYAHDFHDNKQFHNIRGEHIHRHCRNCHFEWPERVIAAQPASPPSQAEVANNFNAGGENWNHAPSQAPRRFGAYNLGMESDTGTTPIGAESTSERQPPCWHKEISDDGICKACGAKAAIKLEGMQPRGTESLGVLRRVSSEGQTPEAKGQVGAASSEQGESAEQFYYRATYPAPIDTRQNIFRFAEAYSASKLSAAERKPDWRKMCIVEIAVENQSVRDYVEHWEGRALKAESQLSQARQDAAKECAEIARLQDESGCCGAMVARKIESEFHLSSESTTEKP